MRVCSLSRRVPPILARREWLTFGRSLAGFPLDPGIDLQPVDSDIHGRFDTDSDLIALDPEDGDGNIISDGHGLTNASREYQHGTISLPCASWTE
jgi:hypothetical protein